MDSKERIKRAIEFKTPDKIPLNDEDMFVTSGDSNWIVKKWHFDEAVKEWHRIDIWGCIHRSSNREMPGYFVINHPLQDWNNLKTYKFPDPNTMIPFLEKQNSQMNEPGYKGKYHLLDVDPGPLLVIINLLGFENFLIKCMEEPEKVRDLYRRISDYKFQLIKLAHDYTKPDGVVLFEDWGTQHGSLISPQIFADLFKPVIKEMAGRIHGLGMHYGIQGSGDLGGILDEYIDAGLDFLFETQINSKHFDVLSKKMKGKVCLMSCCDAQTTLLQGTPEDVRNEVYKIKEYFATPKGGLVLLNLTRPGGMPVSDENKIAQKKAMDEVCGLQCPIETTTEKK